MVGRVKSPNLTRSSSTRHRYVIVDNLQFMLGSRRKGPGGSSGGFDKYEIQDYAIEKFRRFATDKNVHVTLVVSYIYTTPVSYDRTVPVSSIWFEALYVS